MFTASYPYEDNDIYTLMRNMDRRMMTVPDTLSSGMNHVTLTSDVILYSIVRIWFSFPNQ